MMNEPKLIKLLSGGKFCCEVTKDEILANCFRMDNEDLKLSWNIGCCYFFDFVDNQGVCRIDIDDLFDGNTLDRIKSTTVFMIITTLIKDRGKIDSLPEHILRRAIAYASVKLAEMDFDIILLRKKSIFLTFESNAMSDIIEALSGGKSFDECYDGILGYIPSVESYARLNTDDKKEYLDVFEILHANTKYCSSSYYEEIIKQYIDVLLTWQ